jgi:hypothetical protein
MFADDLRDFQMALKQARVSKQESKKNTKWNGQCRGGNLQPVIPSLTLETCD